MFTSTLDQCLAHVSQWKKEGVETSVILSRLKEQEVPEDLAQQAISEWKKQRNLRKRGMGMLCCGAGGALLVLSFLITLIMFDTEHNFSIYLYGFTLIGVSILFKGMVDLLGW